ncbi:MAG: hypothetical protein D6732_07320 [Methanobacteriota archaeon]|nr:MAG: hypothetical protein D6732_07320 [Euryarchaeota archaeon]
MDEEKLVQRLAMKMFLSVGFAVSLTMFGVMFFFVGIFFLGSNSVSTIQYKESAGWWIALGLVLFVLGFFLLIRFLKDSPEPGSLNYKHI